MHVAVRIQGSPVLLEGKTGLTVSIALLFNGDERKLP